MATLAEQLTGHFGDKLAECVTDRKEVTIEVAPQNLIEVCTALRDEQAFQFSELMDVCGIDYLTYGRDEWATEVGNSGFSRGVDRLTHQGTPGTDTSRRFAAVYHLLSLVHNRRLRIRVFAADAEFPVIPSVTTIWNSASWYEREAFDLYGIMFEGHSDLRRILTDYGFVGHPFRKDFPLSGHVEMRYDAQKGRVVYEPVNIEPRILVPRVIRHDNRDADVTPPASNG